MPKKPERPTKDIRPPDRPTVSRSPLVLPPRCITPGALRSLADAMQRLEDFHARIGGSASEEPCLLSVAVEEGLVIAEVEAGLRSYHLDYSEGHWTLRTDPKNHG